MTLGLINERAGQARNAFYVYQDNDSADNHGFPSGLFGQTSKIHLDAACIDDAASSTGCSTNPQVLERSRGTVLQVRFDPLSTTQFAGVNIEEPEDWGVHLGGAGYDLRGATGVRFAMRSPNAVRAQFGVGKRTAPFVSVPQTWTDMSIPLSSLGLGDAELADVHVLFTVVTKDVNAPSGGTVLIDQVRFEPAPARQATVLALPLSTQTFGSMSVQSPNPGRVPVPTDQVSRNLAAVYEASLSLRALLSRGRPADLGNARAIADTLVYPLAHDNRGMPLPVAPDGSTGLRNAYRAGEIALHNDQTHGGALAGDVQLGGFSAGSGLCGPSRYCLVLDGASGEGAAFGLMALASAYNRFGDIRYLNGARTIGHWIVANLADNTGRGYGGYFLGYPDGGAPKTLLRGKSIENNADIASAFLQLSAIERRLGNTVAAGDWQRHANTAGDFVLAMFSPTEGRFYAGTGATGTPPGPGIDPSGAPRGDDVINIADFLDAQTFPALGLSALPRYRNAIDWRRPILWAMAHEGVDVTAGGHPWHGFDLVATPTAGPQRVGWEFTGEMVVAMRVLGRAYHDTSFDTAIATYLEQIRRARLDAPFSDRRGIVATTMQDGDLLAPAEQCLSTPFQCIPARVGLAATAWAIFSEIDVNPFHAVAVAAPR